MNQLVERAGSSVPVLITGAGNHAAYRFLEFFAGTIRNPHTRRAYGRAVWAFLAWCEDHAVPSIAAVQPLHVATWIELQTRERAAPSVKQQLAAIRHLFDWLVTGQVIPTNPAASVRGPSHVVRQGKTPVLEPAEARALLDAIDVTTQAGLRDRALIALMIYSFARIGAALAMKVEDVFVQNRRLWVRLREKGGKAHAMPCHHSLEEYLTAYLERTGIMRDGKGPLFRTIGRGTSQLTRTPLAQANAYAMIARRAAAAGIATKVGNHSFRATGITAYLKNGGTLENAAAMANHASTRTTMTGDGTRSVWTRWSASGCESGTLDGEVLAGGADAGLAVAGHCCSKRVYSRQRYRSRMPGTTLMERKTVPRLCAADVYPKGLRLRMVDCGF